ncbi:nicotinate (nicotinamide) nucleotide adenylyltransferase [Virgibacillus sp. YIM 98842]|jgi:nicotinate-nucleotide adenylyltransferase|uniref:nicotinate (nicotinamide) nucleotide adenylyltransferase n=1 Tax=Virgibacillus sp. YIM 98842 TaxID=2663533 RepID=UPI0013DC57CF|nr:nicotinate (nicotinamide) nucleotide adenylyltransferase [Virgibacillus sp. YIM 98842]
MSEQTIEYFRQLNPGKNLTSLLQKGTKVGVYGSSFDPITNVHLWTASTVAHRKGLDYIIFLPSSDKRRDKQMATVEKHRAAMVRLAINDNPKFLMDTYEFTAQPGKHYSYYTMEHFKAFLPEAELFFIMGADLLADIAKGKWMMDEQLIRSNQFIVMARENINMLETIAKSPLLRNYDDGRFQLLDKGLAMEISSTYIREEFSRGGEPRYLLPESCYSYIKDHRLYQGDDR